MGGFKGTQGNFRALTDQARWYAFENKFFEVVDEDNMIVAFVKDWDGAGDVPRKDAKLLASAPELLIALSELLVERLSLSDNPESVQEVINAQKAIKKAIGE